MRKTEASDGPYAAAPRETEGGTARERLARYGPQALSTRELLAMLLRSGADDSTAEEVAERLLKRFGGLRGVARATVKQLAGAKGVGHVKGLQLAACVELGRRLAARTSEPNPVIRSPEDVADLLMPELAEAREERFICVLVDAKNRVIKVHTASVGTLTASLVHPREVFKEAIACTAAAVIAAHNHPSGDPTPSAEDRQVTARLVECGRLIGIEVLDHVIIGGDRWVSMKERKLL